MQGEEDADHDLSLGLQDHRIAGHEARHAEGGQDHPVRPPVYSVDEDGHTEWQLDLATHYTTLPSQICSHVKSNVVGLQLLQVWAA